MSSLNENLVVYIHLFVKLVNMIIFCVNNTNNAGELGTNHLVREAKRPNFFLMSKIFRIFATE